MNLEPREIRLPRRLVPSVPTLDVPSVLDEAFASVTEIDFRRDEAHDESPTSDGNSETAALAELVREQLNALKQQQAGLASLLESLSK